MLKYKNQTSIKKSTNFKKTFFIKYMYNGVFKIFKQQFIFSSKQLIKISLSDTLCKHFTVTELPKTQILLFVYCFNDQNNKQTAQIILVLKLELN